jgi:outer membrane protein OmpA-like peptidoglycan-associated protein
MKVEQEWMNISDMMSGLMMIFLFIAISFMIEVEEDKNRAEKLAEAYKISQDSIKEIVVTYQESQEKLNQDLYREFEKDLNKWGAEITEDNIFRFNSPEVLFKTGSSNISPVFKHILKDFFPRYVKLLTSQKYINEVDEIRIEGHTTNDWGKGTSYNQIYLKNMKLSQNRANKVLAYCYSLRKNIEPKNKRWLEEKFRANGMAFSKLIYKEHGTIDYQKSKRVEFKVVTKAQEKIYKIIEQFN